MSFLSETMEKILKEIAEIYIENDSIKRTVFKQTIRERTFKIIKRT